MSQQYPRAVRRRRSARPDGEFRQRARAGAAVSPALAPLGSRAAPGNKIDWAGMPSDRTILLHSALRKIRQVYGSLWVRSTADRKIPGLRVWTAVRGKAGVDCSVCRRLTDTRRERGGVQGVRLIVVSARCAVVTVGLGRGAPLGSCPSRSVARRIVGLAARCLRRRQYRSRPAIGARRKGRSRSSGVPLSVSGGVSAARTRPDRSTRAARDS
jgi:hypothetical protein